MSNNNENENENQKPQVEPPVVTNKEETNDNKISQMINIGGKIYKMEGTVNIKLTPTGDDQPDVPNPEDPVKPTEGTIKEGGWGANMDPKTWVRTVMRNPSTQFKVVDGAGKNVATNFTTPQNADNFITYFQRHPDEVSKLNGSDSNGGTSGGGSGGNGGSGGGVNPGGNGGGTVTPGADEVAGIKIPYKTTGKVRVDDWHYNANDGLRADFEGNPKDGSFTNNVAVFYGTFVGPITTKEDRAVKWSWARHTGSGTRVNTYIVNIRNGDGATRSRMEVDHPNGYETMVDWGDHEAKGNAAKTGQLWGIMGVRRNVVGAADGKVKAVRLELYEDQGIVDNKPGNQWVKLLQHDDTKYLTTTYPNGMEVTGRFDDDKGDKNIKISKALIAEVDPQKA